MVMLFAVINDISKIDKILYNLAEQKYLSGTIFESTGMRHSLYSQEDAVNHFGIIRSLLHPEREKSKTLMFVVEESDAKRIKKIIIETIGNYQESDLGFFAVIPAIEGLSFKDYVEEA